jgi:hypothetical protein
MEAKIDAILLAVHPRKGEHVIEDIDARYEGRHTDKVRAKDIAKRNERE